MARLQAAGTPAPLVSGATPSQRFLMANATNWRGKYRTEALMEQLHTDSHSPGRWRVLAPLPNTLAFALDFARKPGDATVAPKPIAVW